MVTITTAQNNALYSLWIHAKCGHEDAQANQYHAERLDALQVSWTIQNQIAEAGRNGLWFSDTLKRLNITTSKGAPTQ